MLSLLHTTINCSLLIPDIIKLVNAMVESIPPLHKKYIFLHLDINSSALKRQASSKLI